MISFNVGDIIYSPQLMKDPTNRFQVGYISKLTKDTFTVQWIGYKKITYSLARLNDISETPTWFQYDGYVIQSNRIKSR